MHIMLNDKNTLEFFDLLLINCYFSHLYFSHFLKGELNPECVFLYVFKTYFVLLQYQLIY